MRRTVLLALALGSGMALAAAENPIGMAVASGTFRVDHSQVWGTTTLFDGSMIETEAVLSQLHLAGGVDLRLGSGSRATVYQRKLLLDYGQLESSSNFEIEANSLRIMAGANAMARIQVRDPQKVQVAALRGAVRVTNSRGVLVANIEAGRTLNLEPQSGASDRVQVTGCLLVKAGKMIVADQTANVLVEVRGTGFDREAGNRVNITGVPESGVSAIPGVSQVVKVISWKRVAAGGCTEVAKKAGAAAAGAAAAGAGAASTAAAGAATAGAAASAGGIGAGTVAVIGGVAAAASLGSLGLAGALPGQGSTVSR